MEAELNRSQYEIVQQIVEDGLYVGKRPIVGAHGQSQLLNEAGTVFYHTLLYLRKGGKVWLVSLNLDLVHSCQCKGSRKFL